MMTERPARSDASPDLEKSASEKPEKECPPQGQPYLLKRTKTRIRWMRRVWWRRYLYSSFFRILSWIIGLALIGIGILFAPSPIPVGFVFFIVGSYVIARRSRWGRGLFKRFRSMVPPLSRALNRTKTKLPQSVQRFIEKSDPGV